MTLDLRTFNCPMPLLKTRQALKSLACGDTLTTLVSDPAYLDDLNLLVRAGKCRLLQRDQVGHHYSVQLQRCC